MRAWTNAFAFPARASAVFQARPVISSEAIAIRRGEGLRLQCGSNAKHELVKRHAILLGGSVRLAQRGGGVTTSGKPNILLALSCPQAGTSPYCHARIETSRDLDRSPRLRSKRQQDMVVGIAVGDRQTFKNYRECGNLQWRRSGWLTPKCIDSWMGSNRTPPKYRSNRARASVLSGSAARDSIGSPPHRGTAGASRWWDRRFGKDVYQVEAMRRMSQFFVRQELHRSPSSDGFPQH